MKKGEPLYKFNLLKTIAINSNFINFNLFFPRSYTRHNKKIVLPDFESARTKL